MMCTFNYTGLAMIVACFIVAFGIGIVSGSTGEEHLMLFAGPLLFALDGVYRLNRSATLEEDAATPAYGWRAWFDPRRGGHVFFVPVWALGLLWMSLGSYRLLRR